VSFELDPLLDDPELNLAEAERTRRYIELGQRWSAGHRNRMIKVPNTPAGWAAMSELTAAGVTLNVTLTFTPREHVAARDAIWRGAQRRRSLDEFKSIYSVFVSREDVYTAKHVRELSPQPTAWLTSSMPSGCGG
jgi:transaldolase